MPYDALYQILAVREIESFLADAVEKARRGSLGVPSILGLEWDVAGSAG